jgi:phosphohistidine phosphatase SixA
MKRRSFIGLLALVCGQRALAAQERGAALWRRLQGGGHVVLMRHAATVPGIGDPPGFKLGQCSTQRNLSAAGREDAANIGAAFRRHAVPVAHVLSSRWCRCTDTARLAFGRVDAVTMLDSLFTDDDAARQRKLDDTRAYLAAYKNGGNLVLVTHDVNIRALVGEYASEGEMIVALVQPGGKLQVVGRLADASVGQPRPTTYPPATRNCSAVSV